MDTDFDDWLKEEVDTSDLLEGVDSTTIPDDGNFDDIFQVKDGDVDDVIRDDKVNTKGKERTLSALLADADDILAGVDDFSGDAEDIKLESLDLKSLDIGDDVLEIKTTTSTKDDDEEEDILEWDPTQDPTPLPPPKKQSPKRRMSADDKGRLIESELESDTCDADTLRVLCAEGVPSHLRSKIWARVLMAQEIEDVNFDDEAVSSTISKACLSVAEKVWSSKQQASTIAKQMASMLHVYDSKVDEDIATNSAWLCVPLYMSEFEPTPSQNERLAIYEELRNCVVRIISLSFSPRHQAANNNKKKHYRYPFELQQRNVKCFVNF